ncbi:hypothetical protein DFH27DRAFT_531480 [Peziza echinospora]|nr:hypothetical protein DFH27DRAFT_531480 [Peziza echinospora]
MVLSYSITALTAHLDKISLLRSLAHSTDPQKVSVIPVGLSGFILFARDHQSSRLAAVSTRLKALASLISDVRIFMRLWGLLGIYEWGLSTYRAPPKDKTLRNIAYAQVAVNVFYQILENLAYLGQHKVLPVGPKRQNKFWLWSSRFWMMHVVLEFWRLKRDRDLNLKKGKAVEEKEKKAAGAVGEGEVEKKIKWYDFGAVLKSQTREGLWLKQLWSNAAYAPLTVHWSLESGALSPLSVGTLGTIAGVIGLQQAWRNSA